MTQKERYQRKMLGIDVSEDGKNWEHLAINGKPYFAKTEVEREQKRKEIRGK